MKRSSRGIARGVAAAVCVAALTACDNDSVATLPDFTDLVGETAPAVVNISTVPLPREESESESPDAPMEEWFKRYFEDGAPTPNIPPRPSLGSGFIISKDGYILTNQHVVSERGQIVVKLNDRRQMTAELVGADEYSDIALIKVDAEDLPAVRIGDPDLLRVGSWVVAIGSPFGFETSVTAGIVSAKRRSLAADQYVPFIQSDVAINPGNSGGPLFNLDGEVVGVNAQIYSRSGGFQGVSFAVPIDVAIRVAGQLKNGHVVQRGWLGVQIQEVDLAMAESFRMQRPEGALVSQVLPGSPAQAAGIEAGDVILSFNGNPVTSASGLPPLVGLVAPGESVPIRVLRNGTRLTVQATVGQLQKSASSDTRTPARSAPERQDLGLTLRDLSGAERSRLGVTDGGVRIDQVRPGPGQLAGLEPGDVIVAVGPSRVDGVEDLRQKLATANGPVALRVLRDGAALYLPLHPG